MGNLVREAFRFKFLTYSAMVGFVVRGKDSNSRGRAFSVSKATPVHLAIVVDRLKEIRPGNITIWMESAING